jgi:hypothetical protein
MKKLQMQAAPQPKMSATSEKKLMQGATRVKTPWQTLASQNQRDPIHSKTP